ncbi:MAG TPA: response regulator transcription factor [Candidatus Edwardsbacteria bacterium]|nr:response regulator transcription factor [Candidatus Edwardsbacteria bacterium]
MNLKVMVVDDHRIVREGLVTLLERLPGIKVVAQAETGTEAVKLARELAPDVIIMDISLPDLNGVEATRRILARPCRTKVIALSMHADRRFVIESLKAGASAYLLKDAAFDELSRAIDAVVNGGTYLSSKISDLLIKEYNRKKDGSDPTAYSLLTSRERQVLQLLAEGNSTKQIAGSLGVSIKTIETFRQQIMNKLNLHSVAELTKYAIREGITTL